MPLFKDQIAALKKLRAWLLAENCFYAKLLSSSLIGIFTILLLGFLFVLITLRERKTDELQFRALHVLRLANKLENELATLETAHRGYLLTSEQSYLDEFNSHARSIGAKIDQLTSLVLERSAQRKALVRTKQLTLQWLEETALPTIENRSHLAGTDQQKLLSNAKTKIDAARALTQKLQNEEQILLNERTGDQQWATVSAQALLFIPKLEKAVAEMEKGQSGYLLTGNPTYMDSFERAAGEFAAYHGYLSVLRASEPEQIEKLKKIFEAVQSWKNQVAEPLMKAKAAGRDVLPLVKNGPGKKLIQQVRAEIKAFENAELSMYDKANFYADLRRLGKAGGLGLLCLLALMFLVASSWYGLIAYVRHLRKLESAERQTRSIIETSLDTVLTIDDHGVVKSINPAGEKMFGFPAIEIIGHNISKIIPQRLFLHDISQLGRGTLMAVGNRQGYYPFPIEISLSETKLDGCKYFVALIRDMSERKRSEDTLRHIGIGVSSSTGDEFVRSLAKNISKALQTDFAFILELADHANEEGSCSLLIAEEGQIRRRSKYELTNTACEEVLKKGFRVFASDVRASFPKDELLLELRAESFVGMPLVDHKGKAVGLMGVIDRKPLEEIQVAESALQIFAARAGAEIERKRAATDLAAEKERLAVTLRSIADGFIAADVDGNIVLINKIAERLTGWSQEQAVGKPLAKVFTLLNERTRRPCLNAIQHIVETGSVLSNATNAFIVARDGSECLIESSAAPIRDKNNQKTGVVLVFRDITERQRTEEERRKAEKLESLGVAAGGIAHDFNNLLTAIIGNLSLALISGKTDSELTGRLAAAKKASVRAQELAQQLLTFAKGGAPIKKTAPVGQLIQDTLSFSLRGSNVRGEFDKDEKLWPVDIDSGQISQVISNLIINAEQAMPAGGTIYVKCENLTLAEESPQLQSLSPGKYVKITVQDEGIGIPEEYVKKIFDPYFTTKPKGSGLGLATAYSIVKNHDGLITVDSKAGSGSTFCIYLPASEKEVAFETARQSVSPRGKGKVLVLDDEEAICALVTHALTPLGYRVTEAQDATTAIRLYSEAIQAGEKFDAVIMDLTIPGGMGGREAVAKIKEIDPAVKAIVSSGYANDPIMSRYKEYGFCGMIAKPYELSDLGVVVHDVISTTTENPVYHDTVLTQLA